jgi:tRNA dimethylallyltransferase
MVVLTRQRDDLNRRINARVKRMFDAGFVEEVRALLAEPQPLSKQARQALGYAEVIDHLSGGPELDKTIERIKIHTRRFAKSQRTWFRTFHDAQRIELTPDEQTEDVVERIESLIET